MFLGYFHNVVELFHTQLSENLVAYYIYDYYLHTTHYSSSN